MKKNLEFALCITAAVFAFSCASSPRQEKNDWQNDSETAQILQNESEESQKENKKETENAANFDDFSKDDDSLNSNSLKNDSNEDFFNGKTVKNDESQGLNQNPPKVQTAPLPPQPNLLSGSSLNQNNEKNIINQENKNKILTKNLENLENSEKNQLLTKENSYAAENAQYKNQKNQKNQESDENQDGQNEEKINENDLAFDFENENAPTADEKIKVEEPEILEFIKEPEVIDAAAETESETQDNFSEDFSKEENSQIFEKNENENENPPEEKFELENLASEIPEEASALNFEALNPDSDEAKTGGNQAETDKSQSESAPSRSVKIKKNQFLDVDYPGNGWIYLGENETEILRYFGRKSGNGTTSFSFRSKNPGNSTLHFYKSDALTGKYIDDYLEVLVEDEAAEESARTLAPSYAEIVPPRIERTERIERSNSAAENQNSKNSFSMENLQENQNSRNSFSMENLQENQNSENKKSNSNFLQNQDPQKTENGNFYTQEPDSKESGPYLFSETDIEAEPEVQISENEENSSDFNGISNQQDLQDTSLLEKAQQLFDEKKYSESLENLLNFINMSSTRLDEAYYLLGQIYESDSPVRNIKSAFGAYNAVTRQFPLSKLWKKANERSIYLKRFYIDIR